MSTEKNIYHATFCVIFELISKFLFSDLLLGLVYMMNVPFKGSKYTRFQILHARLSASLRGKRVVI